MEPPSDWEGEEIREGDGVPGLGLWRYVFWRFVLGEKWGPSLPQGFLPDITLQATCRFAEKS